MTEPQIRDPNGTPRRLVGAVAVFAAALVLVACGSDSDEGSGAVTTTVTTVEGEAAAQADAGVAASTTANPEVSGDVAGTDAAAAIPGEQSAVADQAATVAPTTTTTPTTGAPAAGVETGTGGVGGVTGEVPNSGVTTTDPATGQPTTAGDPAATPAPATAPSQATVPPTGITPEVAPDPVLPGAGEAILRRPFSIDSPWNTPVAGAAVDRRSKRWIRLARIRIATVEQPNGAIEQERRTVRTGLTVNVTKWTVPVFSDAQPGAVQRIAVCRQFDCGPDAVTSVTIPPDACPDPRYDGWMTVIDNATRDALDFWRARCEADGSISYHYVKRWDLDGPGFQQPGGVSARGSGLPLFAGLITPEEIRDGNIDHALAISVPGAAQRRYTQPASRTDGVGAPRSLPEGARIRLRPGSDDELTDTFVRNGTQRRTAKTIIAALERYGAIVVDRSAAPTMYAQRNARWLGILPLNLLQDIGLDRFEAVQAGPILLDPPRAGEPTSATAVPGTPGSIPGTTSGSQGVGEFGSPSAGELVP